MGCANKFLCDTCQNLFPVEFFPKTQIGTGRSSRNRNIISDTSSCTACRQAKEISELKLLVSELLQASDRNTKNITHTNYDKTNKLETEFMKYKITTSSEITEVKDNIDQLSAITKDLQVSVDLQIANQLETENRKQRQVETGKQRENDRINHVENDTQGKQSFSTVLQRTKTKKCENFQLKIRNRFEAIANTDLANDHRVQEKADENDKASENAIIMGDFNTVNLSNNLQRKNCKNIKHLYYPNIRVEKVVENLEKDTSKACSATPLIIQVGTNNVSEEGTESLLSKFEIMLKTVKGKHDNVHIVGFYRK